MEKKDCIAIVELNGRFFLKILDYEALEKALKSTSKETPEKE